MRHRSTKVILDRKIGPRTALLKSLATSLVLYEKVQTTEAKAKALKPLMDKLITTAKKKDLIAKRKLNSYLLEKPAVAKLLTVLVDRFQKRNSGYTRITKLGPRKGDGAKVVQIEFVD